MNEVDDLSLPGHDCRVPDRENPDMSVVTETDRLILRPFTEADVDDLVELDSDPEVMRFLTGGTPTPREKIRGEILPRILSEYARFPGWGRWAAIEKSRSAFIGWFALDPPQDGANEVELGYRLCRSAWGKGFGTEGSRALVDKAFTETAAERVWARTIAVNNASRRVMEKAGLTLVRAVHPTWDDPIDGSEYGEVEYQLRRSDWAIG